MTMNVLEALRFIKENNHLMARPVLKPENQRQGRVFYPVYYDKDSNCYRNSKTDNIITNISIVSLLRPWEVAKEFIDYETFET